MTAHPEITRIRHADDNHQVVTVEGGPGLYRRSPCPGCPWRVDQTGAFPAEAFLLSAPTAYDVADRTFGRHESGTGTPMVCAGFLLRGADDNLSVRLAAAHGRIDLVAVHDGGHDLHDNYRAMAVANGCDPGAAELRNCRP